jgi:hypothetical protein
MTISDGVVRRSAVAGAGVIALLLHGPAWGQAAAGTAPPSAGFYATPSMSVAEEYRSNINETARAPKSDFVSMFTPGLSLGYSSTPFTLLGSYTLTSEVYADNSDLDSAVARQVASVTLRYSPDQRLTLRLDGAYTDTNNASQFLQPFTPALGTPTPTTAGTAPAGGTAGGTGAPGTTAPAPGTPGGPSIVPAVSTGRTHASVISASAGASYALAVQTTLDGNFGYTQTRESGSPDNVSYQGSLQASHVFTHQDSGRLSYRLSVFEGTSQQRGLTTNSGLVGWTHSFTELLTASADIGPRFDSDGGVGVDANARIEYGFEGGSASLSYSHGEGLVVGRQGASLVDTVLASVSYQPLRELVLSLTGGVSRTDSLGSTSHGTSTGGTAGSTTGTGGTAASGSAGAETQTSTAATTRTGGVDTVYNVGVNASYRLTQTLSLRGYYQFSHDDQSGGMSVDSHIVGVALDWSYPFRIEWFE